MIYRDTNSTVVLDHPVAGPLTAEVFRGSELILGPEAVSKVDGKFSLLLTYEQTKYDGPITIVWKTTNFEKTTKENVVTPIVSLERINSLFSTDQTVQELRDLEEAVRTIIESYTQQSFGYFVGKYLVQGTGSKTLALPQKLLKLNGITSDGQMLYSVDAFSYGDGWYLESSRDNYLTIKMAPPEELLPYVVSGVIHVPDSYYKSFYDNASYVIDGEWGYLSVPEDVQHAALLLANDYACNESVYRDRYLKMVKSASDNQLQFHNAAFAGTGNVRADQILRLYKRNSMAII